jgi:hypothetical protein
MDPNQTKDRDTNITDSKASTATATARADADRHNPGSPPASTDKKDLAEEGETKAEAAPGFAAFRLWVNAKLRRNEGLITINHAEKEMIVEELLPNGQLRLTYQGAFYLVPFGGDVIEALLPQILGE